MKQINETDIKDYNRMFCYLWYEKNRTNECKFGERWVPKGVDAIDSCNTRIKESIGVRKDLFRDGEVVVHKIWDVTEYAKSVDRCHANSRVDDQIRNQIGFRKGTTGEIHNLNYLEMSKEVNILLSKLGQPLPTVGLSTGQYTTATEVLQMFDEGKKIILTELCARFGKTLWSSVISVETDSPLTIITSYVLTSFAGFMDQVTSFEQFKGIVHIDTRDDNYQEKINSALAEGKKVFAYLSLHDKGGAGVTNRKSKRQERIDYLFNLSVNRLMVVDEADFGAHKPKQAKPLIEAINEEDRVILMTGTSAEKASNLWNIDGMTSTTYFELLEHKRLASLK